MGEPAINILRSPVRGDAGIFRFKMAIRLLLLLGSSLLLLWGPRDAGAQSQPRMPSVVELFTSQGCSSCPPADKLFQAYAGRADLIALSYSVDYWDYLGWKDTLASPKFTARQRAYSAGRGDGEVYTPQIVVNGLAHVVGSHSGDIDKAIERTAAKLSTQYVTVNATGGGQVVKIDVGAQQSGSKFGMGTVWLAIVRPKVEVEIKHGENRGKKLTYYNVVRDLTVVGAWTGAATHIELPDSALRQPGERCAVLLQAGDGGRIIGAAWVERAANGSP